MHKASRHVWMFREDGCYWSATRQFMFIVIALFVLALPIVIPMYHYFSQDSEEQYNRAVAIFNSLDFEERKILYASLSDSNKVTFESYDEMILKERHTAIYDLREVLFKIAFTYTISSALYFFIYVCLVQVDNRGLFATDEWGQAAEDDSTLDDGCFFYADLPMTHQMAKIIMVLAMGPVALPFMVVSGLRFRWCINVKRKLVDLQRL